MATYQDHIDGILDALNTVEKVAYPLDSLPDVLPPYYIEISLSRRVGGVQRSSGLYDGKLLRVVARAVAKTVPNAYRMWDLIDALEGVPFTVAGLTTTPAEFETDADVIAPDAGWYSGSRSITYALI